MAAMRKNYSITPTKPCPSPKARAATGSKRTANDRTYATARERSACPRHKSIDSRGPDPTIPAAGTAGFNTINSATGTLYGSKDANSKGADHAGEENHRTCPQEKAGRKGVDHTGR